MQRLDVLHFRGVGIGDRGRGDLVDALLKLVADSATDDEVWQVATVEDVVWRGGEKLDITQEAREAEHRPMYWSIVDILLQRNLTGTMLRTGCRCRSVSRDL